MLPGPHERDIRARQRAQDQVERAQERMERAQERIDRAQEGADRAHQRAERAARHLGSVAGAEGKKDRERPMIWLREEPRARRPAYSRDRIAAAAVEIADAEGFEAVSMRRVAQLLGSGTMTLYHYVLNKDELITLMVDAVMGEVLVPEGELASEWRPALGQIARRSHEAFRRHRWTLDTLGDGRPGPNGIRHFEQSLQAVSDAPISNEAKFELIGMVDDYVFGFALREAQEFAEHARGFPADVREFLQRELDSGEYPLVRQFLGTDVDAGIDRVAEILFRKGRFERGLERLLDGIEAGMNRS